MHRREPGQPVAKRRELPWARARESRPDQLALEVADPLESGGQTSSLAVRLEPSLDLVEAFRDRTRVHQRLTETTDELTVTHRSAGTVLDLEHC